MEAKHGAADFVGRQVGTAGVTFGDRRWGNSTCLGSVVKVAVPNDCWLGRSFLIPLPHICLLANQSAVPHGSVAMGAAGEGRNCSGKKNRLWSRLLLFGSCPLGRDDGFDAGDNDGSGEVCREHFGGLVLVAVSAAGAASVCRRSMNALKTGYVSLLPVAVSVLKRPVVSTCG